MMKQRQMSKGYGSIRKLKVYGAVGVLSLVGVMIIGSSSVSADEVVTTDNSVEVINGDTGGVEEIVNVEESVVEDLGVQNGNDLIIEGSNDGDFVDVSSEVMFARVGEEVSESNDVSRESTTSVTISRSESQSNSNANSYNVSVETELPDDVKSSDYVDYTFENLPTKVLDGLTLKNQDGVVIGSLKVLDPEDSVDRTIANYGNNDQDMIYSSSLVRAVFDPIVDTLKNISYTFGYSGQSFVIPANVSDLTIYTAVKSGDKVVTSFDALTKASKKDNFTSIIYVDGPGTEARVLDDGSIVAEKLTIEVKAGSEGAKKGDVYTVTLEPESNMSFKVESFKVGSKVNLSPQFGYTDSSLVDDGGYIYSYINDANTVIIKEVTEDSLTFVIDNDLNANSKFGVVFRGDVFSVSPTIDQISGDMIINVENLSNVNGKVVDAEQQDYIRLVGNYANVKASVRIGSVVENYYIEGTKDKLKPSDYIVTDVNVGIDYVAKTPDDRIVMEDGKVYRLVSIASNLTGKVIEGLISVDNYYQEVLSNVVVHYVDEEGNVIANDVWDVLDGSIGTEFDTTDNKPEYIEVDGVRYKLQEAKTVGDETGTLTEAGAEVTYVYHKIVTNWLDQDTNEALKDSEDGEQDKGEFDGYDFVETIIDEETGDVTHYFKRVPVEEVTEDDSETPTPEVTVDEDVPVVQSSVLPLTGDETTPLNIMASLIGVLMFVFGILGVRKRKED